MRNALKRGNRPLHTKTHDILHDVVHRFAKISALVILLLSNNASPSSSTDASRKRRRLTLEIGLRLAMLPMADSERRVGYKATDEGLSVTGKGTRTGASG